MEHVARTARFDWLLVPSSNLDKVHQGGFIEDAVTLNYPSILVEDQVFNYQLSN